MSKSTRPFALIVGGSSGMGLETARLLRARGLDLMLLSQNPEKLDKAVTELSAEPGGQVESVAVNLYEQAEVEAFVDRIDALGGRSPISSTRRAPSSRRASWITRQRTTTAIRI